LKALSGASRTSYQRPQVRTAHISVGQGSLKIFFIGKDSPLMEARSLNDAKAKPA
jgi:hypothetical protein